MASWESQLTAELVRGMANITDNSFDTQLDLYIDAIIEDIETLTGLDFATDNTTNNTQKVYKRTLHKNRFVLDGKVLQPGAWTAITDVESAAVEPTPTWEALTFERDYDLIPHRTRPRPFYQIKFLNESLHKGGQIRITGTYSFAPDVPPQLKILFSEAVGAYYNYLLTEGLASGAQNVKSEKDLTSTITLSETAFDNWKSPKLFDPSQIEEFGKTIDKFNTQPYYPF